MILGYFKFISDRQVSFFKSQIRMTEEFDLFDLILLRPININNLSIKQGRIILG